MTRYRWLLSFAPLVAFYLLEERIGLRAAVAVSMALGLLDVGVARWVEGRASIMGWITTGMIVVFGGMSLLSDDPRFVLWSPVWGNLVFAALMAGSAWKGRSLVELAVAEQDPQAVEYDVQRRFLRGLSWRMAGVLVVHTLWIVWAIPGSRETWLFVTGPGQYLLLAAQGVGEFLYARNVVLPEVDRLDAERLAAAPGDPV